MSGSERSCGLSVVTSMAGGQELALVILAFLPASALTGSLASEEPSVSDERIVKPGWENVFDRLGFRKSVLLKREVLGIIVMPGRLWLSSLSLESSWGTFPGRQE